jgi:hypothetical protein
MSNPKKHDSGAPEGCRRPTEDAPESSAEAGGRPSARSPLFWTCCAAPIWKAPRRNIASPQPPSPPGRAIPGRRRDGT